MSLDGPSTNGSISLCIKQFNARLGDELNLKVGDKVEVLADDSEYNDGWFMGKNLLTEEVGLYPKSFTQILTNEIPEGGGLLRSRSRRVGSANNNVTSPKSSPLTTQTNNNNNIVAPPPLSSHSSYNKSINKPVSSVSKLSDSFEKMSVNNGNHINKNSNQNIKEGSTTSLQSTRSPSSGQVTKTMSDIDKALQELQADSFTDSPNSSHNNINQTNNGNHNHDNKFTSNGPSSPNNLSTKKANHNRNPSAQSLTEDLNPSEALQWTPKQVSSYFAIVLGFDLDIAGKFARHKITGAILFQLDLTHLKELDIDSFGTRFEVYKEIENLKQISSRSKEDSSNTEKLNFQKRANNKVLDELSELSDDEFVSPPHSKNNSPYKYNKSSSNNITSPHNNSDEDRSNINYSSPSRINSSSFSSQSQSQLLPSVSIDTATPRPLKSKHNSYSKRHQRNRSQSMENILPSDVLSTPTQEKNKRNSDLSFMSPRKAPEPPAQSPLNKSFKFGQQDPHTIPPHAPNQSQQNGSSLYLTRTNASSAGLGISNNNTTNNSNGNGNTLSRPASSIYDNSVISDVSNQHKHNNNHRRNSSVISGNNHRRHSSLFSFLSGGGNDDKEKLHSQNIYHDDTKLKSPGSNTPKDQLTSPAKVKRESKIMSKTRQPHDLTSFGDDGSEENDLDHEIVDIDESQFSPKKSKSLNRKAASRNNLNEEKRSTSESTGLQPPTSRLKTLRTASTQNFRNLTGLKKLKTSAFQEGIREVTPDDAIKSATYNGWMSKKSGSTLGWRSRYFTLHGTRLSYFASLRDKKEKGLIDITAHKVIPVNTESDSSANSNDKYVALYASSTGFGRYCFKLVPPAPGFKKGLTFTQPKTHFFAVDTYEEMRGWMKALMTATIDIDDSVPVVSSCSTPTVSLSKAQELLAKAREETKLKDEELRAKGFIRDGFDYDDNEASMSNSYANFFNTQNNNNNIPNNTNGNVNGTFNNESITSDEHSPIVDSLDETTMSSVQRPSNEQQPKLSIDTSTKGYKSPSTPQLSNNQAGFASPYLLASGLLSPKLGNSSIPPSSPTTTAGTPNSSSVRDKKRDYFNEYPPSAKDSNDTGDSTPKSVFSNSNGRVVSGSKKKDKMLAYSNDGSGNHTFVIKQKK